VVAAQAGLHLGKTGKREHTFRAEVDGVARGCNDKCANNQADTEYALPDHAEWGLKTHGDALFWKNMKALSRQSVSWIFFDAKTVRVYPRFHQKQQIAESLN
jgi:hypothetical protein